MVPRKRGIMKNCTLCFQLKPLSDFYNDKRTRDGKTARCTSCHSQASYESRKKSTAPHARRGYDRKIRLKSKYGLTLEAYDAMLAAQGGVCAICLEPPGVDAWDRSLHVDHNHRTGRVRGLLCGHCNTAIGKMRDDVERLARAITYLEKDTCCEGEPQAVSGFNLKGEYVTEVFE